MYCNVQLAELRDQLRRAAKDPAGARLFSVLYPSWCYSAGTETVKAIYNAGRGGIGAFVGSPPS